MFCGIVTQFINPIVSHGL